MFDDKVVLITGGTGSFGRKFTQIMLNDFRPRKLIVFSRDELKQHETRQRYPSTPAGSPMRHFLGDVRDVERLRRAMQGVDFVVHAAALKQVPACEYNPIEAIMTNVMGAKNVIDAALDTGVQKVLALSTDKAVNPVNLYGATKLVAEKLFVHGNAYSGADGARFSCVRYGNVMGSRGSVIPLFLEQRRQGSITITDSRMTRFWITLERGYALSCAVSSRCTAERSLCQKFLAWSSSTWPRRLPRTVAFRKSASDRVRNYTKCSSPKTRRARPWNSTICSSSNPIIRGGLTTSGRRASRSPTVFATAAITIHITCRRVHLRHS